MPRQTSVQVTEATERQIAALQSQGFGNFTDIVRLAIDRMHREEKSMFLSKIYATPDSWGNDTWYYDPMGIALTIRSLKRNFPEHAEEYSRDDCEEWELVAEGEAHALYRESGLRTENLMVFSRDGDQYAPVKINGRVAQYSSIEEAQEDFPWVMGAK